MMSTIKDWVPVGDRSGIYRLRCGNYDTTYVDRTYRKLKIRCKEHLSRHDSYFYIHINESEHMDAPHTVKLLHNRILKQLMNHLEKGEIKIDVINSKNNLNRQEEIKMTLMLGDSALSLLFMSDKESRDLSKGLAVGPLKSVTR